jgi:amino acid permease
MTSLSPAPADQEPLLQRSDSPTGSNASYNSIPKSQTEDEEAPFGNSNLLDRSVENDVLPETAVLGRNLGWSSAYILIMSRVIGSGIFATPGAIVRSVGSVGITLLLWIAGALIAWVGLAISLEYGCMLPRSGGGCSFLMRSLRKLLTI